MQPSVDIEPELNSLSAKLAVEINSDRKEVEFRTKRIQKNEELLRNVKAALAALHPERKTTGYGLKAETIRDAISSISAIRFTQDDVQAEIMKVNPELQINRSRIRSALWLLASEKKVIRQLTKGTNRKPAEFEKIEGIVRTRRVTEQDKEHTLRLAEQANGASDLKGSK